nr:putative protein N(5)-glutamine methyltransferase [Streptomyces taklimakanensis]
MSAVAAGLRAAGCVFAEDEARLVLSAARTPDDVAAMVERRAAGLPLEHVLGWAEFRGLRISVGAGVFVPRRRTEFLADRAVAAALRVVRREGRPPVVVDLCCGSGAVGAALAAAVRRAGSPVELHAADVDPEAVRCARRNVADVGGLVHEGDLYGPLPVALRGRVDVLAVNAPYVPTGEIGLLPAEARDHEPAVALDGGSDGLDVQRRVIAGAPEWLAADGTLLVETGRRQAPLTAEAVVRAGLVPEVAVHEELEATVVVGVRPAPER